jgi:hypothetical protein
MTITIILIYLVSLGLCTWFGPKVVAVFDRCTAKADIENRHSVAGFVIGLIPIVNVLFVLSGGYVLWEVRRVLKEEIKGNRSDLINFNAELRELDKKSRG